MTDIPDRDAAGLWPRLRRGLASIRRTCASAALAALLSAVGLCGCRALPIFQPNTEFPNALIAPDGSEIHLATLTQIVNDPDLDDEQKRDLLEELGIEDESIQDYLLDNL